MAPKRRSGNAARTVVTTKKVVEETTKVVVSPEGEQDNENLELVSSTTKEKENVQVMTPSPRKEPGLTRTIPIQDEDETQPASEPETTPTPPQKKQPPPPRRAEPETPQPKTEGKKGTRKRKAAGEQVKGEKAGAVAKRLRKRGGEGGAGSAGYKTYVFKVMKQVHPEMGIASKAMTVINNLMSDMFERLAEEAARLVKHTGRRTLSSREVQGAVKLVLPGELGRHAIAEGTKAVSSYISFVSDKK